MKFGILYEHQLPRPWRQDSELRLFQEALDQVELADRIGIDYAWEVEHHFLEEYSHSSAPEVFLAAASQRTTNIRLGHGIVQTPPPFNHPARVAERIATLDLLSDGRVDFGTGESSSEAELGGFGINAAQKRDMWREGLEVAVRCLTEEPFAGHDGTYVKMPPRNVVPKPLQKPHPPLWVACSRRDTIRLAAEHGLGALSFSFIDPEDARGWVNEYEEILADRCTPIGRAVNARLSCVTPMMVHASEEQAVRRGLEGANFFGYSLGHYYIFGDHRPGRTDVWAEYQQRRGEVGYSPDVAAAVEQERLGAKVAAGETEGLRGAVGDVEQVREYVRRYEEAGVDELIFVMQAGRNLHEHICEAIELFGTEILPEFAERADHAEKAKDERLAGAVEAAMDRRPEPPPPPEDYTISGMLKQVAKTTGDEGMEQLNEQLAQDRAEGKPLHIPGVFD
jgi:alkanesulfonate monooxygenase SsuD/methylene tetrahydromethanopterin reductase-like flavin-dependent oxidoreductase (luciferase family)